MAQFLVVSKTTGKVEVLDCVRIAKKSLIFNTEFEGKTQVPKEQCYYYTEAEHGEAFKELRRLGRQIRKARKERNRRQIRELLQAEEKVMGVFKKVMVQSTRF